MKRFYLIVAALFLSMTAFAQNRGDMFISGTVGLDLGIQKATISDGSYSISEKQPSDLGFSFGVEYGYFAANNLRLALSMSVPVYSSPDEKVNGKWLRNTTASFAINPNVAYYVRLAERFYYTPEIGVSFTFGSNKEQLTTSESYKTPFWGWNVYANLIALEFRVSERVAIGALVGEISYRNTRFTNKTTSTYLDSGLFNFDLNNSSIHIRFYF